MAHDGAVSKYTVGEVARRSGASVRALHHYDEIGLLHPSKRGENGYRLYTADDLVQLRQIRFYRELDFGLEEIAEILADPHTAAEDHLRRQHQLLRARRTRDARLLAAIEHEMEVRKMGMSLTPEEQFEVFGTDKLPEYADEAERRWGDTDAFGESRRRTAAYTKEDWTAIRREADENIAAFAAALAAGSRRPARWRWISPRPTAGTSPLVRRLPTGHASGARRALRVRPALRRDLRQRGGGLAAYVHDAILADAERVQQSG